MTAQDLVVEDLSGNNQEKSYRVQIWITELGLNLPGVTSEEDGQRRKLTPHTSAVAEIRR